MLNFHLWWPEPNMTVTHAPVTTLASYDTYATLKLALTT